MLKELEKQYPSDLNKLPVLGQTKVRLRKRVEEQKECSLLRPVTLVPDNESKNKSREHEEGDEEEGVADHNEDEDGDREAQEEDGYKNVEDQRRYGLEGAALVISQSCI